MSRENMPKQFVPLVGEGSTFQQVLRPRFRSRRCSAVPSSSPHGLQVCGGGAVRERGVEADIVLEPMRRDSGPAVAVSAVLAAERDSRASCWCLRRTMSSASLKDFTSMPAGRRRGRRGKDRHIRCHPTHAATNYGYIRSRQKLNGASALAVEAFVEKPDAATAANYVAERYLWNSGNFVFHAATMLDEIEDSSRRWPRPRKAAVAGLTRDLDFLRLASEPLPGRRRNRSTMH